MSVGSTCEWLFLLCMSLPFVDSLETERQWLADLGYSVEAVDVSSSRRASIWHILAWCKQENWDPRREQVPVILE